MSSTVRFESGEIALFDHIEPEGPMWCGRGDRMVASRVAFKNPFISKPAIQVAISAIDAAKEQNLRLRLSAEQISNDGFLLEAHTWDDTRIGRLSVSWLAVGPDRDDSETGWNV